MDVLSLRLSAIAGLVPQNANVCDVGTDHGFLPVFLKKRGDVNRIIATDINEKPLKKAEDNIKKSGVDGISLRLCDGLEGVKPGEVDTVIIAGIGGEVISGIIDRKIEIFSKDKAVLIAQPTTSPEALRRYLCEKGFEITAEIPISENGKLYSVMKCEFIGKPSFREEWFYYAGLVDPEDETGRQYIEKQKRRCYSCMTALENIPSKAQDYNYYKKVFLGLSNLG